MSHRRSKSEIGELQSRVPRRRFAALAKIRRNGVSSVAEAQQLLDALDDPTVDPDYIRGSSDPWGERESGYSGTVGEDAQRTFDGLGESSLASLLALADSNPRARLPLSRIALGGAGHLDFEVLERLRAHMSKPAQKLLDLALRIRRGELERGPSVVEQGKRLADKLNRKNSERHAGYGLVEHMLQPDPASIIEQLIEASDLETLSPNLEAHAQQLIDLESVPEHLVGDLYVVAGAARSPEVRKLALRALAPPRRIFRPRPGYYRPAKELAALHRQRIAVGGIRETLEEVGLLFELALAFIDDLCILAGEGRHLRDLCGPAALLEGFEAKRLAANLINHLDDDARCDDALRVLIALRNGNSLYHQRIVDQRKRNLAPELRESLKEWIHQYSPLLGSRS